MWTSATIVLKIIISQKRFTAGHKFTPHKATSFGPLSLTLYFVSPASIYPRWSSQGKVSHVATAASWQGVHGIVVIGFPIGIRAAS